jgi:16S rRNA (cytosine967-C5)-methyltransferase
MKSGEETIPLWRQLNATAGVVMAVRGGASGTAAIESVSKELRAGVQALAFHVWRNLGRAQALRTKLASKLPPPPADALLCVSLALAWDSSKAPYDMFTLVNQTVEAAKRGVSTQAQANFLNACLRRFLRERDALVASTDADPVAFWNHPLWWVKRLQKDHPQNWRAILQVANSHAPMTLRVNVRKTTLSDYQLLLAENGVPARATDGGALLLDCPVSVQQLPGFTDGWVSVQDAAAQIAAPLLLNGLPQSENMRILDACAAPGGKTGHLLELTNGQVVALEIDARRAVRIRQNLSRLGLDACVLTADAAHPEGWWDGQLFDAVLLDAPCTASGIVRRHPDVRWLRRESDIAQLSELQKTMLQALWKVLRPGGRMVYCTCSVFRDEGSLQVKTFLTHNTDAVLLPSPGHLIPQNGAICEGVPDNQLCDYDGFYYALLQKQMG